MKNRYTNSHLAVGNAAASPTASEGKCVATRGRVPGAGASKRRGGSAVSASEVTMCTTASAASSPGQINNATPTKISYCLKNIYASTTFEPNMHMMATANCRAQIEMTLKKYMNSDQT